MEIKEIPLKQIKLAKNSRLDVTDDSIVGLMQSIKENGLLQPIGVYKTKDHYEICYGNRRFLAASKLGRSTIPAVICTNKTASDADMKNLTENIQRRNISLTEVGRYLVMLKKSDLSMAQIAIRLGVTKNYVRDCINAYQNVPKEFRDDLEVRTTNDRKKEPGKIAIGVANAIISASKTYNLSAADQRVLFKSAKSSDRFEKINIPKYVSAIKHGSKNPVEDVVHLKHVRVQFFIDEVTYKTLESKNVTNGPFRSMNGYFIAVLKGEKAANLKIRG